MTTVDLVAGARPNFVKLAPVYRALVAAGAGEVAGIRIVHTGQHYDDTLSAVFFEELEIPEPDVHLEVGSGSHGAQTARILERYEEHLLERGAAATVVFGDVNSTVACALAAVKLGVPVAHVEAGLRSFDRTMPEEINRILTDAVAELLLVSEPSGEENLRREGVPEERIRHVGNVMIDSLLARLPQARSIRARERWGLAAGEYGLLTLHRPSNVDEPGTLTPLLERLRELATDLPLVFPVHPRTRDAARRHGAGRLLEPIPDAFLTMEPLPYIENLSLMSEAAMVITDSGGMQEETAVLGVPCLTLRDNTERPITVERGTSRLLGNDPDRIEGAFRDVLAGDWGQAQEIPLWDGESGGRIAREILQWLDHG